MHKKLSKLAKKPNTFDPFKFNCSGFGNEFSLFNVAFIIGVNQMRINAKKSQEDLIIIAVQCFLCLRKIAFNFLIQKKKFSLSIWNALYYYIKYVISNYTQTSQVAIPYQINIDVNIHVIQMTTTIIKSYCIDALMLVRD